MRSLTLRAAQRAVQRGAQRSFCAASASLPSNLTLDEPDLLEAPVAEALLPSDAELLQRWDGDRTVFVRSFADSNAQGEERTLEESVWAVPIRRDIVHNVAVWQRAGRRQGTAKSKTRAEISGGGRKPRPQKGTGMSRHGSIRSPLWRGGSKAHGKKPRDWSYKLNKKVRRAGLRCALAAKLREGNLIVVDEAAMDTNKTGVLAAQLREFNVAPAGKGGREVDVSALLIDGDGVEDANFYLAARNLHYFNIIPQSGANVYDVIRHERLFVTKKALDDLEVRLDPDRLTGRNAVAVAVAQE
jgi:large subunit ribosomal protein L4